MTVRIARTWDSIPPVVYDGDEAISTRVLERQHRDLLEALEAARIFIRNGIELGYIRMPDPDTPDSAHDVPPMIAAAIAKAKGEA